MCLTGAMISTLGLLSQGACSTASVVKMYISFDSLLKLDLMIQASFEFRSFFQYTETFKKRQIFSVGIRSFLISLSDWQSLDIFDYRFPYSKPVRVDTSIMIFSLFIHFQPAQVFV